MALILSHTTALRYLRSCADGIERVPLRMRERGAAFPESFSDGIREVHVLVGNAGDRINRKGVVCHLASFDALPARSFVRISPGAYAVAPELCFVQLAGMGSFPAAVELGFELCGAYSLDDESPLGFVPRAPLTSAARLRRYVGVVRGARGVCMARRAARFVLDGAASPKESQLAMLLTLPTAQGGQGFAPPQLNAEVPVPHTLWGEVGSFALHPDLYWPDCRLDVEYDSDRFHVGPDRIARDAERRNNLMKIGVRVVTVTKRQLLDVYEFDRVTRLIARVRGERWRARAKNYERMRRELRRTLFSADRAAF